MCGGSNVVNVFKQKVNTKNDRFATVTPHNNLFVRLSDHLHCTNRPFAYVLTLRKDMSILSRRSKRTPFRKNLLNEISRKSNSLTEVL